MFLQNFRLLDDVEVDVEYDDAVQLDGDLPPVRRDLFFIPLSRRVGEARVRRSASSRPVSFHQRGAGSRGRRPAEWKRGRRKQVWIASGQVYRRREQESRRDSRLAATVENLRRVRGEAWRTHSCVRDSTRPAWRRAARHRKTRSKKRSRCLQRFPHLIRVEAKQDALAF